MIFRGGHINAQTDREDRGHSSRARRQRLSLLRKPQVSARASWEHAPAHWPTFRSLLSVPAAQRTQRTPRSITLDVKNSVSRHQRRKTRCTLSLPRSNLSNCEEHAGNKSKPRYTCYQSAESSDPAILNSVIRHPSPTRQPSADNRVRSNLKPTLSHYHHGTSPHTQREPNRPMGT